MEVKCVLDFRQGISFQRNGNEYLQYLFSWFAKILDKKYIFCMQHLLLSLFEVTLKWQILEEWSYSYTASQCRVDQLFNGLDVSSKCFEEVKLSAFVPKSFLL
jgi:hypothetical protein